MFIAPPLHRRTLNAKLIKGLFAALLISASMLYKYSRGAYTIFTCTHVVLAVLLTLVFGVRVWLREPMVYNM